MPDGVRIRAAPISGVGSASSPGPFGAHLASAGSALLVILVVLSGLSQARAAPISLTNGPSAGGPLIAPSPRQGANMVYDQKDGYLLLFGGSDRGHWGLNDTWIYRNGTWSELHPALSPPGRSFAMMAYDAYSGYVVLFGGLNETNKSTTDLQDAWLFQGGVWSLVTTPRHPAARDSGMMSTNAGGDDVILFGGAVRAGNLGNHTTWYNDTWRFSAGSWSRVQGNAAATAPPPRQGGEMSQIGSQVLLFGGQQLSRAGQVGAANTTWIFYGGNAGHAYWAEQPIGVGPARSYHGAMVWDHLTKAPFFVTSDGSTVSSWTYSTAGWVRLSTIAAPQGRFGAAMAFDQADKTVVLFGGRSTSGVMLNDTWAMSNGNWTMV
jgi:hypothetical protein